MNGYNNYGNFTGGYNNYNSNYEYQLYVARGNERRALVKNAFALGMLLLIYEFCQFVFSWVFEAVYASSKSGEVIVSLVGISEFFTDNSEYITTAFEMAYSATVIGASFIALMIVARLLYKIDLRSIYRFDKKHTKTIAASFPAIMLLNLAISLIIGYISLYLGDMGIVVPEADFSYSDASLAAFFFQILYGVIIAPIVEETLYRGVVIHLLKPYGKGMAVVISSLIFGLMHGNIAQAANGFCFALVMGSIAVYSDSIIPTICVHMLNNTLAQIPDIADIIESDVLYQVYLAMMISCLILGALVIFAYHRKIRLPKDDGCVLGKAERYQTVMLRPAMIVYWLYIAFIFITSFMRANM